MYKTYSDLLKHPFWQRRRLEIMDRDNFTCLDCGSQTVTLNVHHTVYIDGRLPWEYEGHLLQTLCSNCHFKKHKPTPDSNLKPISEILFEAIPGTLLERLKAENLNNYGADSFNEDALKRCWIGLISALTVARKVNMVNACCLSNFSIIGSNCFIVRASSIADRNIMDGEREFMNDYINKYFKSIITFKIIANEEIKITAIIN